MQLEHLLDDELQLFGLARVELLQCLVLRLGGRGLAEVGVADAQAVAEVRVVGRGEQRLLIWLDRLGEAAELDEGRGESLLRVGVIRTTCLIS